MWIIVTTYMYYCNKPVKKKNPLSGMYKYLRKSCIRCKFLTEDFHLSPLNKWMQALLYLQLENLPESLNYCWKYAQLYILVKWKKVSTAPVSPDPFAILFLYMPSLKQDMPLQYVIQNLKEGKMHVMMKRKWIQATRHLPN